MKVIVLVRPNTYSSVGWSYEYVAENEFIETYYTKDNKYWIVGEIEVPEPKVSLLVELGNVQLEEMRNSAAEDIAANQSRIKEYESKFMMLEAPIEADAI